MAVNALRKGLDLSASLDPLRASLAQRQAAVPPGIALGRLADGSAASEVSLSEDALRAGRSRGFEREIARAFEARLSPEELELLEQAGRSGYLESIAGETDISPEATARRILGGITGYIFGAFRLGRDELGSEDIDEFEREAMRGFERGLGQARALLEGLGVLTGELESDIGATEDLVREGIRSFADGERDRLRT